MNDNKVLFLVLFVGMGIPMMFFVMYTMLETIGYVHPGECVQTQGEIITKIEDCQVSSGFLSSQSMCIYSTDKGQVTLPAGYKTGDKINTEWQCAETTYGFKTD